MLSDICRTGRKQEAPILSHTKTLILVLRLINLCILFAMLDGPAVVRINIFVRSISKIDDVTMVS